MKDPKTDIVPAHHLDFALYTTVAAGSAVDMARHDFCLFSIPVFSVSGSAGTVQLQDSADGVTFADVSGATLTEPIAAPTSRSRFVYVRERDVRRYVRIGINPNGGSLNLGVASLLLNATQPPSDTTYDIDTSAL